MERSQTAAGPLDLEEAASALHALRTTLEGVLEGQRETIEGALACLLAGGHLLLEDAPGTGKTTLARALAAAVGLDFRRIQMTADLLPTDITGASMPVFDSADRRLQAPEFRFVKGPIFGEVVLADELNRTPPRTQSALLEAMAERSVTIDGESHSLPDPFFVIATQNASDFAGTFPLPESQLDRFMMRLVPGYPSRDAERRMLRERRGQDPLDGVQPAIERPTLRAAIALVDDVVIAEPIEEYLLDIVRATRSSDEFTLGASPRAALDLDRVSRALAALDGRDFVTPTDVKEMAIPVLGHRVMLRDVSRDLDLADSVLSGIVESIPTPQLAPDGSLVGR